MTNEELAYNIYHKGEKYLFSELFKKNYGIIFKYAKAFYIGNFNRLMMCGVEIDDLMSDSFFALMYAVKSYCESDTEYKFTTFLKYPLLNRFKSLAGYRTKRGKYEPLNNALSLDAPISEDESDTTLIEMIPDISTDYFDETLNKIASDEFSKTIKSILNVYPLYYDVIYMRFAEKMTLTQTGEKLNITADKVRAIEADALRVLRCKKAKELKGYFYDLIGASYHFNTLSYYKNTHTSSVEWVALKLDQK